MYIIFLGWGLFSRLLGAFIPDSLWQAGYLWNIIQTEGIFFYQAQDIARREREIHGARTYTARATTISPPISTDRRNSCNSDNCKL